MYADLKLAKELWDLSGWDTHDTFAKYEEELVPQYSLGYLLRKLPTYELVNNGLVRSVRYYDVDKERSYYGEADTPEDAAAKLCIELIKQGVL